MSKQRDITLRDYIEERGELTVSAGIIIVGSAATVALFVFCIIVYWPYSVIRERIERRMRPIQLAAK